jgi:hypothetical protein
VPREEITKVRYSRLTRRLIIRAGRRTIKIKSVVQAKKNPAKVPFWRWLAAPAPARSDLRNGVGALKKAVDDIILQKP